MGGGLAHSLLVLKEYISLGTQATFRPPWLIDSRKAFDYDTRPVRSMTNGSVTDIACQGTFCMSCDDCHMYH